MGAGVTMDEEANLLITMARDRRIATGRTFPPGWIDLVVAFAQQVQLRAPGRWIVTIQEQDGLLDIDVDGPDGPIEAAILASIYKDRSERVCMICGNPGRWRIGSPVVGAFCDEHDGALR